MTSAMDTNIKGSRNSGKWVALARELGQDFGSRAAQHDEECSFFRDLGLERCFRDVQAARFHPFQERRQYLFSGRTALGLDPVQRERWAGRPA